jgi:hypothetical protein
MEFAGDRAWLAEPGDISVDRTVICFIVTGIVALRKDAQWHGQGVELPRRVFISAC